MTKRRRPRKPIPTLRDTERTARAATVRRLNEEAQADSERRRARTADVLANMTALSNRRLEQRAAQDRAEHARWTYHRELAPDRERHRLALMADLLIGVNDLTPADIIRL